MTGGFGDRGQLSSMGSEETKAIRPRSAIATENWEHRKRDTFPC
jgi:hypothetical protein